MVTAKLSPKFGPFGARGLVWDSYTVLKGFAFLHQGFLSCNIGGRRGRLSPSCGTQSAVLAFSILVNPDRAANPCLSTFLFLGCEIHWVQSIGDPVDEVFSVGVLQGPVREARPVPAAFSFPSFCFSALALLLESCHVDCIFGPCHFHCSSLSPALGFILGEPTGLKIWKQPHKRDFALFLFLSQNVNY